MMRLRVCSTATLVLIVVALGLCSPAAAKECGFESTLSGPGIAGRGGSRVPRCRPGRIHRSLRAFSIRRCVRAQGYH